MEQVAENFDKLMAMKAEDIQTLYEQYSEWSRHLHSEILTITTFGITISLGSLSLVSDPKTSFAQFIAVGIASLLLLVVCYTFAESVRNQQLNFWAIINYIESYWKIRASNNKDRPLIESSKYKTGSTHRQRRNLYLVSGIVWVVAIIIKILGVF